MNNHPTSGPTDGPTPYDELNRLLVELTGTAREILGDNFAGAYLQGSFALGEADLQSDCDFLIPVHRSISTGSVATGSTSITAGVGCTGRPQRQTMSGRR